jgi:hypothetical protein
MANMGPDGVPVLWENPYSWDILSNVLILEHPPGTGFSYCANGSTPVECQWNDEVRKPPAHAQPDRPASGLRLGTPRHPPI